MLVAFTIVVLGGMGSFAGALVGGLLIGVLDNLAAADAAFQADNFAGAQTSRQASGTALAAAPTTATRRPASSMESSQRAVWKLWPLNDSMPGMPGSRARLEVPSAMITNNNLACIQGWPGPVPMP